MGVGSKNSPTLHVWGNTLKMKLKFVKTDLYQVIPQQQISCVFAHNCESYAQTAGLQVHWTRFDKFYLKVRQNGTM